MDGGGVSEEKVGQCKGQGQTGLLVVSGSRSARERVCGMDGWTDGWEKSAARPKQTHNTHHRTPPPPHTHTPTPTHTHRHPPTDLPKPKPTPKTHNTARRVRGARADPPNTPNQHPPTPSPPTHTPTHIKQAHHTQHPPTHTPQTQTTPQRGGFEHALTENARFGSAIASLGDLDGAVIVPRSRLSHLFICICPFFRSMYDPTDPNNQ